MEASGASRRVLAHAQHAWARPGRVALARRILMSPRVRTNCSLAFGAAPFPELSPPVYKGRGDGSDLYRLQSGFVEWMPSQNLVSYLLSFCEFLFAKALLAEVRENNACIFFYSFCRFRLSLFCFLFVSVLLSLRVSQSRKFAFEAFETVICLGSDVLRQRNHMGKLSSCALAKFLVVCSGYGREVLRGWSGV